MDLNLFRDLAHLQQTGNFTQAASLSHVSQPAFSRRIKVLEDWVGVTLVDRSQQPVKLTEPGLEMLEAGLQAKARVEQERRQILESRALPDRQPVTFATQHSLSWRFYPTWLQEFEQGHGPILSRLRADDLPDCLISLEKGEVDFVIAYATPPQPNERIRRTFEELRIGQDRLMAVCQPHPEGGPLYDLGNPDLVAPFLQFGLQASIARQLIPMIETLGLKDRLRVVYENTMAGALRLRAREGHGVAWLPESLIKADLDMGLLVPTGDKAWRLNLEIHLLQNPKHSNSKTRRIWSFLENQTRS